VSVDGFIARPNNALDFLDTGEQEPHGFEEFYDSVDVVVIGRKTFEVVLKFGKWFYGSKPVVVLSSRRVDFSPVISGVVEQLSGEPAEIVTQLKTRGLKHAYIDGGITIQRFLSAGATLSKLGEDVSEVLEHVPARFKVIQQVRPKLSCTRCDVIVQAEAPSRPIARGLAGPCLLAHVLVSKYADHLPLYRQAEIYAREGVELERSTMADGVGRTSELLAPLNEALRKYVMSGHKLHADDTPVPVLAPGNGKTKLGRLWTYVRDDRPAGDVADPAVWFTYSPDRRGEHPNRHLATFHGTLQADGYAGFNRLYESGRMQEAACWAHLRRKFFDLHQAHASPMATEAVKRISHLYAIESEIRGRSPDERQRVRETRSRPLLTSLHEWFKAALTELSRKSETAAAISYALARWSALLRYCEDGRLEIDNNAAERALRAVALGRKNYLLAGSDSGGERAAAIYSLIGSAQLAWIPKPIRARCSHASPITLSIASQSCCPGMLRSLCSKKRRDSAARGLCRRQSNASFR
jgi:transposase